MVASITDEHGSRSVVISLLDSLSSESLNIRRAAVTLLVTYCVHSKPANISNYRSQLWRGLIFLLSSDDEYILNQSIEALNAITKNMDSKEQLEIVPEICNALRYTISDYITNLSQQANLDLDNVILPGFQTNKGILPILNIFKEALLSSNMDTKEHGANGYRDIIKNASPEALKPSIMGITGPLLRIVADRISNSIKTTISDILSIMLFKAGPLLKPFYPQIQVFFLRSLGDGNRSVRLQAAISLSRFSTVHARIDSFFTELMTILKNSAHNELCMRETAYYALRMSITAVGGKISEPIRRQIIETVIQEIDSSIDEYRLGAAATLGALCAWLSDAELDSITKTYLLNDDPTEEWTVRHFRSVVLRIAIKEAYQRVVLDRPDWGSQIFSVTISYITSNKVPLIISGIKSAAYIINQCLEAKTVPMQPLVSAYARVSIL